MEWTRMFMCRLLVTALIKRETLFINQSIDRKEFKRRKKRSKKCNHSSNNEPMSMKNERRWILFSSTITFSCCGCFFFLLFVSFFFLPRMNQKRNTPIRMLRKYCRIIQFAIHSYHHWQVSFCFYSRFFFASLLAQATHKYAREKKNSERSW